LASALRASAAASTSSAAQQVAASGAVQTSTLRTQVAMVAASARIVAGWAVMGAQALLHAAKVAAAWLIAMGPIGLVIAAVTGLVVLIVKNWDTIRRVTVAVWNAVWGWIRDIASRIASWVSSRVQDVLRFFGLLGSLPGRVADWFGRVHAAAVARLSELVSWVRDLPGRIVSALGNLGRLLFNAGADLLKGLIGGIKSMVGAAVDAAKNVGSSIVSGIKSFLGIGSPSRVMREQVGRWIPAGVAEGITRGRPVLDRAMRDLVTVPSVRIPAGGVRGGDGGFMALLGRGGLHVEHLEVKAFSDRFSTQQVMDELAFHGAS
ncbi:MAG: phage tail protein, partial [Acidimicrobiales bacterium]